MNCGAAANRVIDHAGLSQFSTETSVLGQARIVALVEKPASVSPTGI